MKRLTIFLMMIGFAFCLSDANAQRQKIKKADKETVVWKYELEPEALGMQNTKVIRVWSYSKDVNVAKAQAVKNAVHGIIFKGVSANSEKRIVAVPPLVLNPEIETKFAAFFESFFTEGGGFRRYATTTNVSDKVVKLDKKSYKVGVVVNVQYDALRKTLESEGIVRKLGSGF